MTTELESLLNSPDVFNRENLNLLTKKEQALLQVALNLGPKRYEESLYEFVKTAWKYVESVPFVEGFHIEAICRHLQAVTDGTISNLLINQPPGTSKSLLVSVFWPAWEWTKNPTVRWFYASYDQKLSTRDSVKCRAVISSPWYQSFWGDKFTVTTDQKTHYETSKGGWRMATSVGGHITGEHPDRIVCLPENSRIITDKGILSIGKIVHQKIPVKVLSFNHQSGKLEFQKIEKYEENLGKPLCKVWFTNYLFLEATEDHPVFVAGQGYKPAGKLQKGDRVIYAKEMSRMQNNFPQRKQTRFGHTSHRLHQNPQLDKKSGGTLQNMSQQTQCKDGKQSQIGESVVSSVEFGVQLPSKVYNLRISKNHNYFANGILVHNCDDPHNTQQAESEQERLNCINWWNLSISTRGVSRNVRKVVVMQRLHEDDLSGHILRSGENWCHIVLPMRYESERMKPSLLGWTDPRKMEGELLTPNQFDEVKVAQMEKDLGAYGTAGQLAQRPAPKGGGMFQSRYFQQRVKAAPHQARRVIYVDRAFTSHNESCFTVATMMAEDGEGNYYIGPIKRGRWFPEQRDQEILSFARYARARFGPKHEPTIVVEREPSAGIDSFRHLAKKLVGFRVEPDPVRTNKEQRADPWASQLAAGNVIIVEDGSWDIDSWIHEHISFPNGRYKDQVDSCSGAFTWLHRRRGAIGSFRIIKSEEFGKKQGKKVIISSVNLLRNSIIEERALVIYFTDPPIPEEVQVSSKSVGDGEDKTVVVPIPTGPPPQLKPDGDSVVDTHNLDNTQGKSPSFLSSIAQPLDTLILEFTDLQPSNLQESWDKKILPWNELPEKLVMNRDHGKKIWSFIRKARDPYPEVIVLVDQGDGRALSAGMAISDQLGLERDKGIWDLSMGEEVDKEKLKGKPSNQHVFDMTKIGRMLVV